MALLTHAKIKAPQGEATERVNGMSIRPTRAVAVKCKKVARIMAARKTCPTSATAMRQEEYPQDGPQPGKSGRPTAPPGIHLTAAQQPIMATSPVVQGGFCSSNMTIVEPRHQPTAVIENHLCVLRGPRSWTARQIAVAKARRQKAPGKTAKDIGAWQS